MYIPSSCGLLLGRSRAANAVPFGARSIVQSLLHGSPEAKAAGDVEIQQHTRLVARGKYVHSFESERTFTTTWPSRWR